MNSTPRYIERPNAAAVAMHALMLPNRPSQGLDRTVSPIMHVKMLWMKKQIVSNAFNRSGSDQRTWKAPSKRKLNWSKEWRFWCFSRAHDRVCVTRISRSICAWRSRFLRNSRLCPGTDLPMRHLCEEKTNRLWEFGGVDWRRSLTWHLAASCRLSRNKPDAEMARLWSLKCRRWLSCPRRRLERREL